jgi:hypothetical protein
MNQRPILEDKVSEYTLGFRMGLKLGREEGMAMERSRLDDIEWSRLIAVVVAATFCGSFVAFALVWALATHFGAI